MVVSCQVQNDNEVKDYYPSGEISSITKKINDSIAYVSLFWESGELNQQFHILNEKIHGKVEIFFRNGKVKQELNYENGVREGICNHFYKSGLLKVSVNYLNNIHEGDLIRYYRNGNIEEKSYLKNGLYHGIAKIFFKDGTLNATSTHSNGKLEGLKFVYNNKGNIIQKAIYYNDEMKYDKSYYYDEQGEELKEIKEHIGLIYEIKDTLHIDSEMGWVFKVPVVDSTIFDYSKFYMVLLNLIAYL